MYRVDIRKAKKIILVPIRSKTNKNCMRPAKKKLQTIKEHKR